MKKSRLNLIVVFPVMFTLLCTSCDNFFDVNTDEIMLNENSYKNNSEVYSGFLGISSAFQQAADDYIVLSELRGDLVMPTPQAPMDFWEVYRYRSSMGNNLLNPERYYRIILNSNDFLRNIVNFNKENPNAIPTSLYKGLIASAITYRTWAYMTVGKIYGEAVYYDLALVDNTNLDTQRVLPLDQLIDELIFFMKDGVDGVDAWNSLAWSEIMGTDAKDWYYMTVQPDVLMCELCLWDNNPWDAAQSALKAIDSGVDDSGKADLEKYKLSSSFQKTSWWKMFTGTYSTIGNEAYTAIPYDYSKNQTNKLQYYFSNLEPNVFYLKPNNYNFYKMFSDARGGSRTFPMENGSSVIARYHTDKETYQHDNHIYIYRAADAWLMLAEALTMAGDFEQADSILNVGLVKSWSGSKFNAPFNSPIYSSGLQKNMGIRGRVGESPRYLRKYVVDSLFTNETELVQRKTFVLDSLIAEEVGLESAFEAKRWYTLVRMARNLNKPEFLALPVCGKFDYSERELYKMWLLEPKNWFVKYDQLSVMEAK